MATGMRKRRFSDENLTLESEFLSDSDPETKSGSESPAEVVGEDSFLDAIEQAGLEEVDGDGDFRKAYALEAVDEDAPAFRRDRKKEFCSPEEEIQRAAEGSSGSDGETKGPTEGLDPNRPVRVYADGIYDLFHFGHARSLEQAKKLFPNTYLLVGCCSDALTHELKGKTVMTEEERYESLRHCKWVDEVIEDAPWVVTQEFLDRHTIDYVAHDALPYADASGAANDVYDFVKKAGRFKETRRTNGISTSDIIMRILRDYTEYVMRNLARGYSRKELGVSYVMEKQLYVNMGIQKLQRQVEENLKQNREYLDRNMKALSQNVNKALHTDWVKNADHWMRGFLKSFDASYHFVGKAIQKNLLGPKREGKRQKPTPKPRLNPVPPSLQIAPPLTPPQGRDFEPGNGNGQRQPVSGWSALQEIISAT